MRDQIHKHLGMSDGAMDELDLCLLPEPTNPMEAMIHTLFLAVGTVNPPEMKIEHGGLRTATGYSAYRPCVDSTKGSSGRFGFSYSPDWEPENAITIAVPEWAIAYAQKIYSLGHTSHRAGYDRGEDEGYVNGRNMLVLLAKCEITVDEMENYDPKKDRSRPLYRQWNGKPYRRK